MTSQGESFDAPLSNLQEALELYFEDEPFPEGIEPPIIAPVKSRREPGLARRLGGEVIRVLEKAVFAQFSQRGSHVKLRNDADRTVIVPLHRELARGTLGSILRQSAVSVDEFRGCSELPAIAGSSCSSCSVA